MHEARGRGRHPDLFRTGGRRLAAGTLNAPDRYALFGHPVAHSCSPWLHARFAELTGQSLVYAARDVPPGGFAGALARFLAEGGRGLNVTLPHKLAALEASTRLSSRAERAGAVNTLAADGEELFGDNTDGAGLVTDLRDKLRVDLAGRRVLVIGAGGAARGALAALQDTRPGRLLVAARRPAAARELADRFGIEWSGLDGVRGQWDLLVNATSASLSGARPELPGNPLAPGAACYDLVYAAAPTPFMNWAEELGAGVIADGLGMLVEQAAESFDLWRGVRPPTDGVRAELRAVLGAQPSR